MTTISTRPAPLLVKAADLAKLLSMSESFVRQQTARGDLPHHKLGRAVRFDRAEVLAWLAARRRTCQGEGDLSAEGTG